MAQMIPDFFDDEKTPPGEQDFFNWLAACPSDWLVFHSLDLQAWNRSRQTEIDFLVVVPESGILCIEIKSHHKIEVMQGAWLYHGRRDKSPLKQAEDATKTFVRRLKDKHPDLSRIPVTKFVAFPRAPFTTPRGIEFNPWEIWDMQKCTRFVREDVFASELVSVVESGIKHSTSLRPLKRPVSDGELTKLEQFLRPTFKSTPADVANQELRQLKMSQLLRDQQKPVLSLFKNQDRLVLDGPAGTGKSLIALEVARRMRDQKLRTGLLCFNRLIGNKLCNDVRDDGPLLVAGTVHAKLAEMLEIEIPDNASSHFWNSEFYDLAEAQLLDENRKMECQFQFLVLDEAQDILSRPRLCDLVECLLEGGFENGKWLLAGDFKHQVLANDEDRDYLNAKLQELQNHPRTAKFDLEENCRNYRMVGNPGLLLAGMNDDVYDGYMRGDGNHEFFNPKFYPKDRDQVELLEKEIRFHINRGTSVDNIVVLSFVAPDKSAASKITGMDIPFKRIGLQGKGVSYGSIHEFKGLESNVVILTDVRQPTNNFERDLFYVGMTRALFSVSILVAQADQSWFVKAIQGN